LKRKSSQQLAVRPEERMRAVELADRHLMSDQLAEPLAFEPGVKVEGRLFDLERWRA